MAVKSTIPPLAPSDFDRRMFLDALLAVGFVSTAVAIAYPVSRFLIPPASGEPQALQNRAPSGFSWEHWGQTAIA